MDDDERRGESRRVANAASTALRSFAVSISGGERRRSAGRRPLATACRCVGQRGRDADRLEEYRVAAGLMDDAALVAVELRLARDAVGDREADELTLAVDLDLVIESTLAPRKYEVT